jgi:hypothetical protein
MQTLEPTEELHTDSTTPGRSPGLRKVGLVCGATLLFVAVAAAAFGAGRTQRSTKTIVPTVATPAAASATQAPIDDRGFSKVVNGHQAETNVFEAPVDSATRLLLQHQLVLARNVAMRYPTVADAEAAGWRRTGPFMAGLGVHFFKFRGSNGTGFVPDGPITDAAILAPASLIYDGTQATSRIAGLMYLSSGLRIPQGFAGPNDVWHYHTNVCYAPMPNGGLGIPFGPDSSVTQAMCDRFQGTLLQRTPYMLHVWVVPGYDSPQGIFSHDNEAITCRDGTYYMIPLDQWGTRTSACIDGGE